jgi:hypothetical protein
MLIRFEARGKPPDQGGRPAPTEGPERVRSRSIGDCLAFTPRPIVTAAEVRERPARCRRAADAAEGGGRSDRPQASASTLLGAVAAQASRRTFHHFHPSAPNTASITPSPTGPAQASTRWKCSSSA